MNDEAISALKALANTLTDQQKGLQGQIDAINEAIKALQDGGAVAQEQIDQAINDQITAVLTPVQSTVNSIISIFSNAKTSTVANPAPAVPPTDMQA